VYRVQLERTGSILAHVGRCDSTEHVAELVRRYIGEPDREHFVAIYLDANYTVLALHTVAIGGRSSVAVSAAEVFKAGLLVNATGVTLAHNHPSGKAAPSKADRVLTSELEIAGMIVGIQLIDHVILGDSDAVSMREADLMMIPIVGEFDCDAVLKGAAQDARRDRRRAANQ
jgi:DNA repair protein RadC